MRSLSLEVATKLLDVLVVQYPALREAVRSVAGVVMEAAYEAALEEVDDLLSKEKDPFTVKSCLFCHCPFGLPCPFGLLIYTGEAEPNAGRFHVVKRKEGKEGGGYVTDEGSRECSYLECLSLPRGRRETRASCRVMFFSPRLFVLEMLLTFV